MTFFYNYTKHYDIKQIDSFLCWVSFMPNVTNNAFMLNFFMSSVMMLSVVAPSSQNFRHIYVTFLSDKTAKTKMNRFLKSLIYNIRMLRFTSITWIL
jgi:hypothetical protein